MTLRLCVCVLTMLMITLISLQHPLPVLNSENSKIPDYVFAASQCQEREEKSNNVRHKRQAVEEVECSENQNHNLSLHEDIENKNNEENDRKKRLENEEQGVERNQYYKPLNEETRKHSVADSSKQDNVEKLDRKMKCDLSSPGKINVANVKRLARQAADNGDMDPSTNNAWVFRSENKMQEELNENSNEGNIAQTLSTGQRREREIPEAEEAQHLRSETLETIKKINPLTIGDQVEKMIHDRKCNKLARNKLRSTSSFGAGPAALQNEAHVVDSGNCLLHENDDAVKKQSASDKQQAQRVAERLKKENEDCARNQPSSNKRQGQRDVPCLPQEKEDATRKQGDSDDKKAQRVDQKPYPSNDYGFSVIILAGDPLKFGGSGAGSETEGKEYKSIKDNPKISDFENTEDQTMGMSISNVKNTQRLFEPYPKKELRVLNPHAKVEFPIYDQDLSFIPDPFNGLLDENYWVDPLNKEDNILVPGGVQSNPLHRIHVRGILNKNGARNGIKDENCDINAMGDTNGSKSSEKAGNFTADNPVDLQNEDEVEPFGDLIINLNNTSCLSYGALYGNSNNKTSTNNTNNNNKSVTY